MDNLDETTSDAKFYLLFIVLTFFGTLGGYLFYANKKMYDSGIHQALNKKAKNKR